MAARQARVRTESMVQRFAAKPISEGFDLWDRDYLLGALRLFTFKAETAPPFQLGPCLDAVGEIALQLDGDDDARESFALAADKYKLIQQPLLAELMRVKLTDVEHGSVAALAQLRTLLAQVDKWRPQASSSNNSSSAASAPTMDNKTRTALARCYTYLAELLLTCADASPPPHDHSVVDTDGAAADTATQQHEQQQQQQQGEGNASGAASRQMVQQAADAAARAIALGYDRVHVAHCALGDAYEAAGQLTRAHAAYADALARCPRYVAALERQIETVKRMAATTQASDANGEQRRRELLALLDRLIAAHPRAAAVREKAFLLAEDGGETAALAFLEPYLTSPPLEEAESVDSARHGTTATLLKAKAAILADAGRLREARAAVQQALQLCPGDVEAAAMAADIDATSANGDDADGA